MIYLSVEHFFEQAASCVRLSREEELDCARRMRDGDAEARERLIESYLPVVAGHVRKTGGRSLELTVRCCCELERAVDSFDFFQEGETFVHRLSWHLRQATAKWIAER